jgi:hypothetical protein
MAGRTFLYSIGLVLALLACCGAAWSQGLVIVSMAAGECELRVESSEEWKSLRLRAHHPNYKGCQITKDEMVSALDQAFGKEDPPRLEGVYSSLSIGRLIDFPWLSQYLATTAHGDPQWDSKKGRPVGMDINKYVSQRLSDKALLTEIEGPFAKGGYRVGSVTVEKVLVGSFRDVPLYQGAMHSGKVPYDAQVWFRLKKE